MHARLTQFDGKQPQQKATRPSTPKEIKETPQTQCLEGSLQQPATLLPGTVGYANAFYKKYGTPYNFLTNPTDSRNLVEYERIGQGLYGAITRATWNGNEIAVKTIQCDLASTISESVNEINVMQDLNLLEDFPAPHFLGYGNQNGQYKIAMEYMPTLNVKDFIHANHSTLNDSQRYTIIQNIVSAVYRLHTEAKIIHQDIKPANFLIDDSYHIKICDFAFSKKPDHNPTMCGSLVYLSPEILQKGHITTYQSDIYSLGIVMWVVMSDTLPYSDLESDKDVVKAIMKGDKPNIPATYPPKISALIRWCLHQKPEDRPNDDELSQEVKTELNEMSTKLVMKSGG